MARINVGRLAVAVTIIASSALGFSAAAGAAGHADESGVLRVKGPGSVYAGSRSGVNLVAKPGASVAFAFQVKNTGTEPSQYGLEIHPVPTACNCTPIPVVTVGSTTITSSIYDQNRYFTTPVAAGALQTYTVKATVPRTGTSAGQFFGWNIQLENSGGDVLDFGALVLQVAVTTGTTDADQFVSATGTAPNGAAPGSYGEVTAPSVAVNKPATFTVKVVNDTTVPTPITLTLTNVEPMCAADYAVKVTSGATEYPDLEAGMPFTTAALARGASKSFTVKITPNSDVAACLAPDYYNGSGGFLSKSSDGASSSSSVYLIVNLAANN